MSAKSAKDCILDRKNYQLKIKPRGMVKEIGWSVRYDSILPPLGIKYCNDGSTNRFTYGVIVYCKPNPTPKENWRFGVMLSFNSCLYGYEITISLLQATGRSSWVPADA